MFKHSTGIRARGNAQAECTKPIPPLSMDNSRLQDLQTSEQDATACFTNDWCGRRGTTTLNHGNPTTLSQNINPKTETCVL